MNVGIIIQSRMSSSRLPGKALKSLAGYPMTLHVVQRCAHSERATAVVVATSDDLSDDSLHQFCTENGIEVFRGNLTNVLKRYYDCATHYGFDIIVRVTGDCPLIDPAIIDHCVDTFQKSNVDYVSNTFDRVFPRGLDCEVFSYQALKQAYENATEPYEQEHVTPYITSHGTTASYIVEKKYHGNFRLTVDQQEDYELMLRIYDTFYKTGEIINVSKVIEYLTEHAEIAAINANVNQKHSVN